MKKGIFTSFIFLAKIIEVNIPSNQKLNGKFIESTLHENIWCPKEDLNFHALSSTSTSTMRVYHSTIRALIMKRITINRKKMNSASTPRKIIKLHRFGKEIFMKD